MVHRWLSEESVGADLCVAGHHGRLTEIIESSPARRATAIARQFTLTAASDWKTGPRRTRVSTVCHRLGVRDSLAGTQFALQRGPLARDDHARYAATPSDEPSTLVARKWSKCLLHATRRHQSCKVWADANRFVGRGAGQGWPVITLLYGTFFFSPLL